MFMILDITSILGWPRLFPAEVGRVQEDGPHRIPYEDRPTAVQCGSRKQVEQEVVRLLQASPGRRYALFECVAEAETKVIPWAVTAAGDVVKEVRVPQWSEPGS